MRALNRATLARQMLLWRSPMSALDAIEHLIGMQGQAPFAPYYGLWSRIDGFTFEELSGLLTSRKAVRIVLMRGTIHLVTAKDCHRLRPLVQPVLDRMLRTNATHGKPRGRPLTIDELVLRYLAAFGPASAGDVQTWSGLTRLGEVLERLDLIRVKIEGGQMLYDIPTRHGPMPTCRRQCSSSPRSTTSCSHMPIAPA